MLPPKIAPGLSFVVGTVVGFGISHLARKKPSAHRATSAKGATSSAAKVIILKYAAASSPYGGAADFATSIVVSGHIQAVLNIMIARVSGRIQDADPIS